MIRLLFAGLLTLSFVKAKAQFGFERIDTITVINGTAQTIPWAGGIDFAQFSNIDLNWDGAKDLFVFDRTCNKILTFVHSGASGVAEFIYAPQYEAIFPNTLTDWVLLADYNCDGLEDIFAYSIGAIDIYKNVGSAGSGHQFQLVATDLKEVHPWYMNPTIIPVSSIDIPSIVDVDGDSDMDILVFDSQGTSVEYHRNMSMENFGNCDSLSFEIKNLCWGKFQESGLSNQIQLNTCGANIPNPESVGQGSTGYMPRSYEEEDPSRGPVRHSGGTLLALDMDANGVMDLIIGDISFPNMTLLMNGGTAPNQHSAMVSQDISFPSNTTPVNLDVDPGAYYVDVNNDGIRDLLVSPVIYVGAENKESVWYYQNDGADNNPDFQYVQTNLLQDEMIDQGTRTLPVFFDYNGDGLKDMLVSSYGQYDTIINNNKSLIAYYQNTGTQANPEFTFVTDDWEDLSTFNLGSTLSFYPTFGDLDNDGDEDMVLGEYEGYCYYFQNTGGAGNQAIYNTYIILQEWDVTGDSLKPIFEGIHPYPQLVDLDRDNDLDLVMGKRSGKLTYYENTGNQFAYTFVNQTTTLGDVDVSEWWNIVGHSIPQFIDIDNEYHLILGSMSGYLHYYDNIDGNILGTWNKVDTTLDNIYIGTYSAPAIYDLTDDNRVEMVVGNKRGGLALYKSAPLTDVSVKENAFRDLLIYPNPANHNLTIDLGAMSYQEIQNTQVNIYDMTGRLTTQVRANASVIIMDVSDLSKGTYLIEVTNGSSVVTKKILLQ